MTFTPPGRGKALVTEAIMRAVIAIAEQQDDPLRQICCETLVETRTLHLSMALNMYDLSPPF